MNTAVIGDMKMPADFPYRSVFLHGKPQHEKYDDFRLRHPQMDVTHRAKIFAPFAALAGYDDCIAAQQVGYIGRRYLSEEVREKLDRKLSVLHNLTYNGKKTRRNRPLVTVTWWAPCEDPDNSAYGTGGLCQTVTGICEKVDEIAGTITIEGMVLPVSDIVQISGELFADPEDSRSMSS